MADVLELIVPRRLGSPNILRWSHWSAHARETKLWEAEIQIACFQVRGWQEWLLTSIEMQRDERGLYQPVETRRRERRRVTVIRQTRTRAVITDDDNLRYATKPLNDALKRLGLVYDDSRDWMEQPTPVQEQAPDRKWRTIIRIERLSQEAAA